MKQHYVPRCYLNEFTGSDGKLASIDYQLIKAGKRAGISLKSPTQLGYEIDFYTIDVDLPEPYRDLKNSRPYLIERDIFSRYEKVYPAILKQLRDRRPLIRSQAEIFIYALVSIKLRNKYNLNTDRQKELLKKIVTESRREIINESMALFPHLTVDEKLSTIRAVQEKIIDDDQFIKGANLVALIERETNTMGVIFDIATKLFNCEWKIKETDLTSMFVTSDNPGFCLDSNSYPNNTKFLDCTFIFPLTPAYCLVIDDKKRDLQFANNSLFKNIQYEQAGRLLIQNINSYSILFCNRYVIAQTKQTLRSL